jgi:hypothetical protein
VVTVHRIGGHTNGQQVVRVMTRKGCWCSPPTQRIIRIAIFMVVAPVHRAVGALQER